MQVEIRLGFTAIWVVFHRALPSTSPPGLCSREVP